MRSVILFVTFNEMEEGGGELFLNSSGEIF
jgi:hypothetical protein